MKQSLIEASEAGSLVTNFQDLEPGMLVNGFIRKYMDYGVFVDLLNGLYGLAPNKVEYLLTRPVWVRETSTSCVLAVSV